MIFNIRKISWLSLVHNFNGNFVSFNIVKTSKCVSRNIGIFTNQLISVLHLLDCLLESVGK